ncbi:hypothetical protein [Stutzerimonas balearica]|uniref:hypothetical protein n=1 Tax=Stutzerimonas balearica TaxID=74829 RepID=UPI0028A19B84|nr:hypothetical protein [Stutzerimonas balearica]
MKTSPIGLLVCTLITGAIGYAQAAPANGLLAQSMRGAPVDRAAGNGSMGTGEGIERLERQSMPDERDARDDEKRRAASTSIDDPGHGGNETDMEHRRRPHLGDDRRP